MQDCPIVEEAHTRRMAGAHWYMLAVFIVACHHWGLCMSHTSFLVNILWLQLLAYTLTDPCALVHLLVLY